MVQSARVANEIDITTVKEDHSVAVVRIQGAVPTAEGDKSVHELLFDKRLLRDPVRVAAFKDDISSIPIHQPNVDVDTHQQATVHIIRGLIERHFPFKVRTPTAPWMSLNTGA